MVENILEDFGITVENGVFVVDAQALKGLHVPTFPPTMNVVIMNVENPAVLQKVLLANYPADYLLKIAKDRKILSASLASLGTEPLEAIYLPKRPQASFAEDFQEVIATLRAPDGCPWDREQTHDSLRSFIIEEVHELLDALDEGEAMGIAEELGDVMLQLFLHAQIACEEGEFQLPDVFTAISSKMRRRHPHVFADVNVNGDVDKVLTNWQEIKALERKENGDEKKKGALDGVSKSLPALLQAQHYQQRAILNGFHWDAEEGAIEKVREEFEEVLNAATQKDLAEEYGDLLFALVSVISYAGFEGEVVLRAANQKFYQRYTRLEQRLEETGQKLMDMSETEKVQLWQSIK